MSEVKPWRKPSWRTERYLVTADSARVDSREPTAWEKAFALTPWLQCEKMPSDFALWIALIRLATVSSMPEARPEMRTPAAEDIEECA